MEAITHDFHGVEVAVIPDDVHEYLMPTQDVAAGFGVSADAVQAHKTRNSDELCEGKHWIVAFVEHEATPTICRSRKYHLENPGKHWRKKGMPQTEHHSLDSKVTLWTKRGVVRLGFLIKSDRAKIFRDWAEDLVIRVMDASASGDMMALIQELRTGQSEMQRQLAMISEHFNPKVLSFNRKLMKERRIAIDMSRKELAYAIGVELTSIQQYELGRIFKPEPSRVKAIAKALGLTVRELIPNS